jgi:hypothetical protein
MGETCCEVKVSLAAVPTDADVVAVRPRWRPGAVECHRGHVCHVPDG